MLARAWVEMERMKREIKLQPKGAKPIDAQVLPKRGSYHAKRISADAPQPPPPTPKESL
jgi:hypothetical protein